jgi:di/tricarboxylate transporter
VFLNFPVALAALPVVALAADRLRRRPLALGAAVVAAGLCAVVFCPASSTSTTSTRAP